MNVIALVDCNSFYASCETIFKPHLKDKPVVVLSNNDGCVIARSSLAKKVGIKMGVPFFEVKKIVKPYFRASQRLGPAKNYLINNHDSTTQERTQRILLWHPRVFDYWDLSVD